MFYSVPLFGVKINQWAFCHLSLSDLWGGFGFSMPEVLQIRVSEPFSFEGNLQQRGYRFSMATSKLINFARGNSVTHADGPHEI